MVTRVVHPIEVQARAATAIFGHYGGHELDDPAATDCLARCGHRLGKGAYGFTLQEWREARAMNTGDISAGGSWTPEGYIDSVYVALENANPWKRVATVYTLPAGSIDTSSKGSSSAILPTVETTGSEGQTYAENVTQESSGPPTIGNRSVSPRIHASGFDFASNTLVRDGGLNFQRGLGAHQGKKAGRDENRHIQKIANNDIKVNKTAASASAITGDEIEDLIASTSAEMREMPGVAKFMMHPNTLLALRKLKDGDLQMWRNRGFDKYPVVENSMMPTIATGNKAIFFGDLGRVVVAQTQELTLVVVTETRGEIYQTGFNTIIYSDAAVMDLNGIELAALALA